MKKKLSFLVIAFAMAVISANAQGPSLLKHIPPDANTIFHINIPIITAKVSWQELISNLPDKKTDSSHSKMMEFLKDPARGGIDVTKDIFIAVSNFPTAGNRDPNDTATYHTVAGYIADAAKFGAMLRKIKPAAKIGITADKNQFATIDGLSVAWNDKMFAFVSAGSFKHEHPMAMKKDENAKAMHDGALTAKRSMAALKGFENSVFTSDDNFKNAFADGADIHILATQSHPFDFLKKFPGNFSSMIPHQDMAMDKGGNRTISSIRFDNGNVNMESKAFVTPHADSLLKKLRGRSMNADLLARIPRGNLLGFLSISIDPAIVYDILGNKKDARQKIDSSLAKKNLKLEDIVNAFKGDFLLVAMQPVKGDSSKKIDVPFCFVISVNGPESLMKLSNFAKGSKDSLNSQGGKNPFEKMKIAFNLKDGILVLGNNQELADAFANSAGERNTGLVTDKMKNSPFNIVLNIKTLTDFLSKSGSAPSAKNKSLEDVLKMIDKLMISGGSYNNGAVESYIELKMTDASENSLRTLLKIAASAKQTK